MKSITVFLLLSFISHLAYSQCDFPFNIEYQGFNCGPGSEGSICIESHPDLASPLFECDEYVFEIIFPTQEFALTSLGDFNLHSLTPPQSKG